MYIVPLLPEEIASDRECLEEIECSDVDEAVAVMNETIHDQNFTGGLLECTTNRVIGTPAEKRMCHVIAVYQHEDTIGDPSPYIEIIAPVSVAS